MSAVSAEHKPAAVGLAQQTFDDVAMICRALTVLIDGTEDEEALRFVRARAALARPDKALAEYVERREAERLAAMNRVEQPYDAHPERTKQREEKYRQMMAEGKLKHWREY